MWHCNRCMRLYNSMTSHMTQHPSIVILFELTNDAACMARLAHTYVLQSAGPRCVPLIGGVSRQIAFDVLNHNIHPSPLSLQDFRECYCGSSDGPLEADTRFNTYSIGSVRARSLEKIWGVSRASAPIIHTLSF